MGAIKEKILTFCKKNQYVILVLVAGILLLSIPTKQERQAAPVSQVQESPDEEARLCPILSQISGVGKVQVMLTTSSGEETVFQSDYNGSDSGSRSDTVVITDSGRNQTGLIRQVNPPSYLGAVIVCQGADRPEVRLHVTEAVSKVTGLKYSQISVLKMK